MPWDKVFGAETPWEGEMPDEWVSAFSIMFSEFKGNAFNWESMRFKDE